MKKTVIIWICAMLLLFSLCACSKDGTDDTTPSSTTIGSNEDLNSTADGDTLVDEVESDSEYMTDDESSTTSEAATVSSSEKESEKQTEETTEIKLPPTEGNINPQFSLDGGIYESSISISLSLPPNVEGYEIRYTTDGSLPTKSSTLYSSPITISKSSSSRVIRAACFKNGALPAGKVITNTYIFDRAVASKLWTVSITAVGSELNNIIENYNDSIEIASHTEIITPEGELVISQDTGLRIFGGTSRALAQKSFKIIARKSDRLGSDVYIGKGSFSYPLFEDRIVKSGKDAGQVLKKYDSFILRNGGNDSLCATAADPTYPTLLRDNIANRFASKALTHFDYALSQFAAVYVNGQYYGILDMRENMNEDYVKNVYGVDDDDVVIVKSEVDTTRKCGKSHEGDCRFCGVWVYYETDAGFEGELNSFKKLCQSAINSTSSNYNNMYKQIASKIDLNSFAEYMALNLYLCNTDWPHNNLKIWRYTGEAIDGIEITDGKWRFMYRDMDFTFGRYECSILPEIKTDASVNMFYRTLGNYKNFGIPNTGNNKLYSDSLYLQGLLDFCLKNASFRNKFVTICQELASEESTETLKECYTVAYSSVSGEITKHIKRWKNDISEDYTAQVWVKSAKRILTFINDRPSYFTTHLDNAMKLYS